MVSSGSNTIIRVCREDVHVCFHASLCVSIVCIYYMLMRAKGDPSHLTLGCSSRDEMYLWVVKF